MSSDYPFGDNAVRPSLVMSSDYPFGDNAWIVEHCLVFHIDWNKEIYPVCIFEGFIGKDVFWVKWFHF